MSERNGRICCLRVIVVKLAPGQTAADLPHQSELRISTHDAVQSSPWGAYIAEILGASFMGRDVLVGDGQNILSREVGNLDCPACRVGATAELLKAVRAQENKKRRFARSTGFASAMDERVEDGFLDPEANYTAFVEIIIPGGESASVGRSPYMSPRRPGDPVSSIHGGQINAILVSVLGILAGLVLVALSLLIALVLLRR